MSSSSMSAERNICTTRVSPHTSYGLNLTTICLNMRGRTIKWQHAKARVARAVAPLHPARIRLVHAAVGRNLHHVRDDSKVRDGNNLHAASHQMTTRWRPDAPWACA